jgi:hypothetical protein
MKFNKASLEKFRRGIKQVDYFDKQLKLKFNDVGYGDFKYDFEKINEQFDKYFDIIRDGVYSMYNMIIDYILKDIHISPIIQYQKNLKYEYKIQLNEFVNCTIYYYDTFINELYYNLMGINYFIDVIVRAGQREYKDKLKTISFELNVEKMKKSEYLNELYNLFKEIGYYSFNLYLLDEETHEIYNKIFSNDDDLFILYKTYNKLNILPFERGYKIKVIDTIEIKSKYKNIITMRFIDYLLYLRNDTLIIKIAKIDSEGNRLKITIYDYS